MRILHPSLSITRLINKRIVSCNCIKSSNNDRKHHSSQSRQVLHSLKLNESELWYSGDKHDSIDTMKAVVESRNGKGFNAHGIIPYDKISKVKMNEGSKKVKVFYNNVKRKDKDSKWEFPSTAAALQFGEYLGGQTKLHRTSNTENTTITLLKNLLWPAGIMAFAIFAAMNPTYESSGSSRSARKSNFIFAIIRMLHDAIGAYGIIAIGAAISLILVSSAFKRSSNPVNDIIYAEQMMA